MVRHSISVGGSMVTTVPVLSPVAQSLLITLVSDKGSGL